ncbi:MAG: hypothetical protein F4213_08150 [Boseongicola sp. SB0677_bin_26]|nr:hypothetical protein [Boseongicola sp. SB0665_bin_10]MYG25983.1 hypothetical protein [Boseongicola sp. SB0677_bin_26]
MQTSFQIGRALHWTVATLAQEPTKRHHENRYSEPAEAERRNLAANSVPQVSNGPSCLFVSSFGCACESRQIAPWVAFNVVSRERKEGAFREFVVRYGAGGKDRLDARDAFSGRRC